MSNITVAVDDKVLQRAEQVAAAKQTTVSGLVRDFLETLVSTGTSADRERARNELVEHIRATRTGLTVGEKPTRERTYRAGRVH